jgi:glycosyltransferase involved in cell wall biosynthesis
MRLLHCIPSMAGGGAERQLTYLAAPLIASGHDVHIALVHGGTYFEALRASGAQIHQVGSKGNYDPRLSLRLLKLIRMVKPDVVQTWLTQMDVFGGIAARIAGVPWIVSERSSALAYPPMLKNRMRLLTARGASAIVANSHGGLDYWQSHAKTTVRRLIRNVVPLDRIEQAQLADPSSVALDPQRPLIVFAGRFSVEKNVDTLIDALAVVLPRHDAAAVFCGDGPLLADARIRAAALVDDGRVAFSGFATDVWSWLRRANVFVSVSRYEGNPNAVVEAMAAGCPVVVSDIPAHREFLDASSALFVDGESVESIVEGLSRALTDRDASLRRASAARSIAVQWTAPKIAQQYADIYEEVAR